jgi:hypothetical protein
MSATPKKICILSPGRCGSLWLESLLKIHHCYDPKNVQHTHILNEALVWENDGYEVIVLRRLDMFKWVLSYAVLDNIPEKDIRKQNIFHKANPNYSFVLPKDKYRERRKWLKEQLQSYKQYNWRTYTYEELSNNPFVVLSDILGAFIPGNARTKLQYSKKDIIENYNELYDFETSGDVHK